MGHVVKLVVLRSEGWLWTRGALAAKVSKSAGRARHGPPQIGQPAGAVSGDRGPVYDVGDPGAKATSRGQTASSPTPRSNTQRNTVMDGHAGNGTTAPDQTRGAGRGDGAAAAATHFLMAPPPVLPFCLRLLVLPSG
jgi:hypothetical protein